jgi:citronellyl-CoA dehydrogenase
MQLTDEHRAIDETMRRFVEQEVNPRAEDWEAAGAWPAHEILGKLGKLGLLGINKPEAYGGQGLDYSYHAVFLEALGSSLTNGLGMGVAVQTDMATPALARYGSDELKREFLEPAIKGEMVTSIAVSEPQAGSDVARIGTTARRDGDDYVISGQKMWITNSTQADWLCLLCNTGEGPVHKNKSLIIVPTKTKGVEVGPRLDKLGMRSSDTAPIFLDEVRVPVRHRIGEEGRGFVMQMQQFQEERLTAAFTKTTQLQRCIDMTMEYARERKIFGRSVLDHQVVHHKLAEMQVEVETLRSLAWRAVDLMIAGEDVTQLASMAKFKAGRLGRIVPDACMQYWGGMGFMWDNFVSRCYRDLRLTSIGGGADEVMLDIIAKGMGSYPKAAAR